MDVLVPEELRGRLLVSIPTTARALHINESVAYAMADAGELPVIKIGQQRRVKVPELLRMLGIGELSTSAAA